MFYKCVCNHWASMMHCTLTGTLYSALCTRLFPCDMNYYWRSSLGLIDTCKHHPVSSMEIKKRWCFPISCFPISCFRIGCFPIGCFPISWFTALLSINHSSSPLPYSILSFSVNCYYLFPKCQGASWKHSDYVHLVDFLINGRVRKNIGTLRCM